MNYDYTSRVQPRLEPYQGGPTPSNALAPAGYVPQYQIVNHEKKQLRKTSNGLGFLLVSYFLTMIVIALVLSVVAQLVTSTVSAQRNTEQLIDIAASSGAALLPGLVYMLISGKAGSWRGKKAKADIVLPIILIGMGLAMIANNAAEIFENNIGLFGLSNAVSMSVAGSNMNPVQIVLMVISVSVVPAFAEEFAFRGIVMGVLRKYGDAFAIVVSSVMFGMMHGNTTQVVFAFILGLIFAYADCVANSIVPSVIIHMINNFYAVVFDIVSNNTQIPEKTYYLIHLSVVVLFCVSALISFIYLAKRDKKIFTLNSKDNNGYRNANVLTLKQKFAAFFTSAGVIVSLCMFTAEVILNLIPRDLYNSVFGG